MVSFESLDSFPIFAFHDNNGGMNTGGMKNRFISEIIPR